MSQQITTHDFTPTNSILPIRCEKCGHEARLVRRSPDVLKGDGTEVWVFKCLNCSHTMSQTDKK